MINSDLKVLYFDLKSSLGIHLEFTVIDKKNGVDGGVVCQNFANFTANFTGFAVFFAKNNYKLIAVIIIN